MLAPCRISTRFERTIWPAWGMNGGGDGAPGHVLIERADGTTQAALKEVVMLKAGDRVRVHTGGGGGYGDPKTRDRDRVRDRRDARLCQRAGAAREIYGLTRLARRRQRLAPALSTIGRTIMPKLRHIAIAAEDPFATAEFYKQAFDFTEVGRIEPGRAKASRTASSSATARSIWRCCGSAGTRAWASTSAASTISACWSTTSRAPPTSSSKLGAKCFARRPEGHKGFYETKFHGPDKVTFDITDHPWRGSAPLDGGK